MTRAHHSRLGVFVRVLALWVVTALAFLVLAAVLPGIAVPSFDGALVTTGLIALLNRLLWPLLTRLFLPITVLTLGLGTLVGNALIITFAINAVDGSSPSFGGALAVAFGVAIVTMIAIPVLGIDGDASQLRVVKRRRRRLREQNTTDVPGVILFEIDGLAERVLRRALDEGHAPTLARWLADGSHRIVPWECDLSSQTGASQAGLLLGSNFDMPAFRWYEKERGELVVSNHPRDAAEIERRRSDGGGLLAANGASRGNLVSGDAPRCMATMSVVRDRKRSQSNEFFSYFAAPYGFARTIALFLWDVGLERRAARRQRKRGEQHVARGGIYPFARGAITVAMRDLNVAALLADIVEGVPVAYATFVGYDEVAHHSGITEPDAFAVLRLLDAQLERLERAVLQAPRPYHFVVLSDHGQTQGRPFRQRYDLTLEELVQRAVRDGSVRSPAAVDEAWGNLGATLTEAREDDTFAGRLLHRVTRRHVVDGAVALGPNRAALEQERADEADAADDADDAARPIVLASGNLGLVYLPERDERMTLEQIDAAHPGLVETLAGHPGIGFVMVRSERDGPVAVGGKGLRRLADDGVEGEDPLAHFGTNAAAHLRRTDTFPHCPDLLVNSMYDPEADEIAPFEEFMGSHGGLGGSQSHPFAVVPSAWSPEPEAIVGVEAMHGVLRTWLVETGLEVEPHRETRTAAPAGG
jgi:uncharacterized membrane protein YvlD (DUF360 family)